jgi:hypothetical protein
MSIYKLKKTVVVQAALLLPLCVLADAGVPFQAPSMNAPWTVAKKPNIAYVRAEADVSRSKLQDQGVSSLADTLTGGVIIKPGATVFAPITVITDIHVLPNGHTSRPSGVKK